MADRPIEFADDHEAAEAQHGHQKRACLDRLDPGNPGRWGHRDDGDEEVARVVATIAWESGWDAALIEARRANAMQQRAFERQENAERGWRQMYEGQLRVTQESDQAWAAKLRDAQDALVRMRAERNEARADAVACAVAYRDRRPINGGVLQRIDGYVGAMRVDRACAQERSLAEQMARVEYVETSLVTDPPDPLCAIDGSRVEEESMP